MRRQSAGWSKKPPSYPPNPGAPRHAFSQARPQQARRRGVPSWYVEPLCNARTKLAVFFTILLDLELGIIQAGIDPADPHEFLMTALFDDGAMLHHNDAIDVMERRQAMCNNKRGATLR